MRKKKKIMTSAEKKAAVQAEDIQGRDKMQKLIDQYPERLYDYYFTPNQYDWIDLFTTASTTLKTAAIEIKNRHNKSTDFKDWYLEPHKYNELKMVQEASGHTPYYVNFFDDGLVAIWNIAKLGDLTKRIEMRRASDTTAYNYKKGATLKPEIPLKLEEATVISYGTQGDNTTAS